jgi:hypothetical protein
MKFPPKKTLNRAVTVSCARSHRGLVVHGGESRPYSFATSLILFLYIDSRARIMSDAKEESVHMLYGFFRAIN